MALWNIRVIDGVVALADEDGDAWDSFNGRPDPYVTVEVVGLSGETEVADDTVFPAWDEIVLEEVNTVQLQGEVEFAVRSAAYEAALGFFRSGNGGAVALWTCICGNDRLISRYM